MDILILRDSKGNVFILDLDDVAELILFIRRPSIWIDRYLENKDCNIQILRYPTTTPSSNGQRRFFVIHVKILGATLSGWMHSIMMKQVVDGKHVSLQVEQYENNLNECLWLSIFLGGWLVGKAHMLHMLIDLEEKCFSPFKLYQRLAVWWVGWAFFIL